jgi:hypothetical protein
MEHILRGQNHIADKLSKLPTRHELIPVEIFAERLARPSVTPTPVAGDPSTST